jgi:transketolase
MADRKGITFLRTTRGKTPVIYGPDERFEIGGSRVVRSSPEDRLTIVGAGITLHEALTAADRLAEEGVAARVIDLYSVKPIDAEGLRRAAAEAGGPIIVVEDHWPEGGLGDAVLDVFAAVERRPPIVKLAVREMPGSGKPEELLAAAGIDSASIVEAARARLGAPAVAVAGRSS